MALVGRTYSAGSQYRYGFNGKEDDQDISEGAIAFETRVYQSRLGKFFSVDPIGSKSPWQTPYAYYRNSPVSVLDWLGLGDKFYGNDGKLLHEDKGKGTSMYVIAREQFSSIKSKYKSKELSEQLVKNSVKAYSSEDDAAKAWAVTGFAATKSDPKHLERAAKIFHAKAFGDRNVSDLYVLGETVIGEKSPQPGVSQQVDPNLSILTLNGKNILTYSHTEIETINDGLTHNIPGYSDPTQDATYTPERINVIYQWTGSGVIHTHQPGNDNFSINSGDIALGGTYGGDIGFAINGYTTYLVPTTESVMFKIIKLNPSDVNNVFFQTTQEGQKYMRSVQKTIIINP